MTRLAALLVIGLLGCSGGAAGPTATPTATPRPTPSPPPTISAECADNLQPLLDVLEDLDGRLNVGLTKVQYGERLGDVSVAYSRLDATELSAMGQDCISTGATLEDAFNKYVEANNAWSDCFADTDCNTDKVKPTLQRHWAEATKHINEARAMFP